MLKIAAAQKAHIFRLLKLHYICRGSPDEHFAVGPKRSRGKQRRYMAYKLTNLQLNLLYLRFLVTQWPEMSYFFNDIISIFILIGLNFYFICTIQIHQKGNTEFIGGMHYTNGIQKKVSRLIRICIPFCTIIYMYSILRNCHNNYKTVCILHVNSCY